MRTLRLVLLGNLAAEPFPGIAWQVAHFMIGLCRLGHDVYYFETSSAWPYDPICESRVKDSEYAVSYLAQMADHFGFGNRWAYRRSYGDRAWFTTVGNWRQKERDSEYRGETYYWSKHREYLKFIQLPRCTTQPVELATGLIQLEADDCILLQENGWRLADSHAFTLTSYRD